MVFQDRFCYRTEHIDSDSAFSADISQIVLFDIGPVPFLVGAPLTWTLYRAMGQNTLELHRVVWTYLGILCVHIYSASQLGLSIKIKYLLTWRKNAFNELLSGDLAILVLVDAAEEIHDSWLLVVHPPHITLPPDIKVEVGKLFQLKKLCREEGFNLTNIILNPCEILVKLLKSNWPPLVGPGHHWVFFSCPGPEAKPAATYWPAG